MGVYKLSTAGGLATPRTNYSSFLAGNPAFEVTYFLRINRNCNCWLRWVVQLLIYFNTCYLYAFTNKIYLLATGNASDGNFIVQFNNDTTSANYVRHYLIGDGSTVSASGGDNTSDTVAYMDSWWYSILEHLAVIDILDYTNTNKYKKVVRSLAGQDSNGSGFVFYISVMYMKFNCYNF
jgi:hypothetical protein